MALSDTVTHTISGLSSVATGNVSSFRTLLNISPGLLPFTLPPQVNAGVSVLKAVGINVPTPSQLISTLNSQVDTSISSVLKGIQQPAENALGITPSALGKVGTSATTVLNSISWLL